MGEVSILTIVTDEGLYQGAGLVNRWFTRIGESMERNIKEAAPVRTGELRAGIILDFNRLGLRIIESVVTTTAEHSIYVLKGTAGNGAGVIYSKRGWANKATVGRIRDEGPGGFGGDFPTGLWMKLSDARDGVHLVVHGQRANNFMAKGYDRTARTHPSLRSFPHT